MYFEISDTGSFSVSRNAENVHSCSYSPLTIEGYALFVEWLRTPVRYDGLASGVLADWLEDNRDWMLEGSLGFNPADHLDRVIAHLRYRYSNDKYNELEKVT